VETSEVVFDDFTDCEVGLDLGDFDFHALTDVGSGDDDDVPTLDTSDTVPLFPDVLNFDVPEFPCFDGGLWFGGWRGTAARFRLDGFVCLARDESDAICLTGVDGPVFDFAARNLDDVSVVLGANVSIEQTQEFI
jgi:hypothetical protein